METKVSYFSLPSTLLIILYRLARWGIIAAVTAVYFSCYQWNLIFCIIMLICFAYCFSGTASLVVNFLVYIFSKPVILNENEDVIKNGIPDDVKAVFFRPIFAKTNPEMDTLLNSMRQDIINNQEPHKNLKFILIDNTRDESVKEYTRNRIKEMQSEFGDNVVFYFHRNVKCDFFKKVGIYQDAIMFLYEGWTRPGHYISNKWREVAKGTRDTANPLFDVILGDIRSLGIEADIDDVTSGKTIKVDRTKRAEIAFVSDADNVWPKGEIRKLVAKIIHPDNSDITIFQPSIELSNPDENLFIKMTSLARLMYGFDMIARWRIYRFAPFFGKGAMRISSYVKEVIKPEVLHPAKAASHDFQEALFSWSVLVEDVYILEKTFSNKLSELMRGALWQRGDMETVQQYLTRKFSAGRKQHLFVLLRNLIGALVFDLWVLGTVVAWYITPLGKIVRGELLFMLFALIVLTGWLLGKFISPILCLYKEKMYHYEGEIKRSIGVIVLIGFVETILSVVIHFLDLVYRPMAFFENVMKQISGKDYIWKTGAMGEIETANATILQTYKMLKISTIIGICLLVLSLVGAIPPMLVLFLSPYIASFTLGPLAIYFTKQPLPEYLVGK